MQEKERSRSSRLVMRRPLFFLLSLGCAAHCLPVEKGISVIVNGGDMLPKLGGRHMEQPIFIKGFLRDYFAELQEHNITYLAMLGNDDLLAVVTCLKKYVENLKKGQGCHRNTLYLAKAAKPCCGYFQ